MRGRYLRRAVGLLVVTAWTVPLAAAESSPLARGVGRQVSDFTLKDLSGNPVRLYSFRGKKAVVLAFLGIDCPVANLYAPRLAELDKAYRDKGVVFLAVNSNAHETADQVAEHAKGLGISFPVLKDNDNLVADILLAERSGEVVVIDGRATLRYRGAVDDQYGQGTRKDAPDKNYLRDALDSLLAGRPVAVAGTTVAGCLLDRVEPKAKTVRGPKVRYATPARGGDGAGPAEVGRVTYAADVAAIVQNKCQSCHRPGETGPFSLLTFDDARRHAAMIREVVDERKMPPWHADPNYGHFANDRSLSARERATLLAWVDQGTPLGDPKALPAPKTFTDGWTIGTPDAVFEIPEPYEVAAQGTLGYVYMKVPTHFKDDVWVQAAEARPGDRGVVHHILVFVDDHQGRRRREGHLCGYAPGDMPSVYPPGTAKKIPAGSELVFQLHYTPNGRRRTDRSKVGLVFAKSPVTHEAHTFGIAQHRFVIPPGKDDFPVRSTFTFPRDAHLLSFLPHMHLRGKSFEYKVTYPDGRSEVLLSVPAYDFGWQTYYTLAEPKAMPKGTRIDCLAHFDNSDKNPYNPDPSKAVIWGEQTFDEMMIGYIDFMDDAPVDPKPRARREDKAAATTPESPPRGIARALRGPSAGANRPSGSR
jgi:peroxiredoxin